MFCKEEVLISFDIEWVFFWGWGRIATKSHTKQKQIVIRILFEANKKQKEPFALESAIPDGDACVPPLGWTHQHLSCHSGPSALPMWESSGGQESAPTN